VSDLGISGNAKYTPDVPSVAKTDGPKKVYQAAQQFEALLLGQILESVSHGGGWLGSGEDSASGCANSFAQEQLATMMAKQGGFGLAKMIAEGLQRSESL
jgi:Rod binding domain-containing protein